jgi:hypothetical protein
LAARRSKSRPLVQGEGDYVSARRYQKDAHEFAREHDTLQLARDAAPRSEAERQAMLKAERKGKSRARPAKAQKRKTTRR